MACVLIHDGNLNKRQHTFLFFPNFFDLMNVVRFISKSWQVLIFCPLFPVRIRHKCKQNASSALINLLTIIASRRKSNWHRNFLFPYSLSMPVVFTLSAFFFLFFHSLLIPWSLIKMPTMDKLLLNECCSSCMQHAVWKQGSGCLSVNRSA